MADKNTGVDSERIGGRSDEQLTGRASTAGMERSGEYGVRGPYDRRTAASSATDSESEAPEVRTRRIRAEIEQTRDDMSETVHEIQDRLRPGTIASNAADSLREATRDRVRDIAESDSVHYVRANPIPAAMVGIGVAGLAWLAFGGNDSDGSGSARYRGASSDWRRGPRGYGAAGRSLTGSQYPSYGAGGTEMANQLSDRTGEVARDLRDSAEQTTRRVRQSAYRAQSQLQRTWNESPLLIGAAAALLGALIGSAVPETERENELMGEARDSMVEGVEQAVKGKVEEVQNAATDAVQQVQKAAGLSTTDENAATGSTRNPGSAKSRSGGPRSSS